MRQMVVDNMVLLNQAKSKGYSIKTQAGRAGDGIGVPLIDTGVPYSKRAVAGGLWRKSKPLKIKRFYQT